MINFFTHYTGFMNIGVLSLILFTIMAQNYTPQNYRWQERTLSDLAIQGYKKAWIMRFGFISFGIFLLLAFISKIIQANSFIFTDFLMIIYALGMMFSGIFSTAIKDEIDLIKKTFDVIHSFLAYFSGIILATTILVFMIKTKGDVRTIHTMFLILSGVVSIFFNLSRRNHIRMEHGIIQRLLISVGLIWILLNYNFLI